MLNKDWFAHQKQEKGGDCTLSLMWPITIACKQFWLLISHGVGSGTGELSSGFNIYVL